MIRIILILGVFFSLPVGCVAAYHLHKYLRFLAHRREEKLLQEKDDRINRILNP